MFERKKKTLPKIKLQEINLNQIDSLRFALYGQICKNRDYEKK